MHRVLLFFVFAAAAANASEPAPVFVFLGLSESAALEQVAANATAAAAARHLAREETADRNSVAALKAAGWAGFGAEVASEIGCFGVGESACRQTTLVSPGGTELRDARGTAAKTEEPLAAVLAQLFIDTQPTARITFLKKKNKGRLGKLGQLNIQYFNPPTLSDEEAVYPFYDNPDRVSDDERERLRASRAFWFSGSPTPLETVMRGFIDVVPRVLDFVYEDLSTQGKPFDLRAWYAGIKPISSYAQAHDFDCRRNDCTTRLLRIDSEAGQAWIARYYESELVIRVVPCDWLWCEAD